MLIDKKSIISEKIISERQQLLERIRYPTVICKISGFICPICD